MSLFTFFIKWPKRISPGSDRRPRKNASVYSSGQQIKYLNDPMRTTSCPDTLGKFHDPMGVRQFYAPSYDITNTGA
ncbi:hypothetical protein BC941DRAFT_441422 [Chlamydoabsidia padenii]|nr:hypothetical protein BC941DRAFT_441422 [Chlamydoabsidia padenii]